MTKIQEMKQNLLNSVMDLIDSAIKKAPYDTTIKALVVESLGDNKYKVKINNNTYTAKSRFKCDVNSVVYVIKPENKFKDLIIIY